MTIRPAGGAGPERFTAIVCDVFGAKDNVVAGEKLSVAFTLAVPLPPLYPLEDAVMVAEPKPTPVTCGATDGVVAPGAMVTLAGTVATPVLLLWRVIVAPSAGAGEDNCTFSATDWPTGAGVVAGIVTLPRMTTLKGTKLTRA